MKDLRVIIAAILFIILVPVFATFGVSYYYKVPADVSFSGSQMAIIIALTLGVYIIFGRFFTTGETGDAPRKICPKCKAFGTRDETLIKETITGSATHQTTRTERSPIRNLSGNITHYLEHQVPHSYSTHSYKYDFRCKSCGYEWTEKRG